MQKRKVIVTSALPYANGPLHLGHILESIQTDIWARFLRLQGHSCWYFCADDAHGTPIMLQAKASGQAPTDFIKAIQAEHMADFQEFGINFANYHSTHSSENQAMVYELFSKLQDNGDIVSKTIQQAYDAEHKVFLPDRYVTGECPKCHAENQYGDNCAVCGSSYSPLELINPRSTLSGSTPTSKATEHLFFKLSNYQEFLHTWLAQDNIQEHVRNKLQEWFAAPLRDWDITRDSPYFGFSIPNHPDKYFYVWLDAPIGYLSAIKAYADSKQTLDFDGFINGEYELYHFIGKDIIYFHALFWPAILSACDLPLPNNIFTHGFVTVAGEKMSKSRDNYITAKEYLSHYDPEHLRYYLAAKSNNSIDDIDFSWEDFQSRVNADVVGKFVNIGSRCTSFLTKYFNNQLASELDQASLVDLIIAKEDSIAKLYLDRDYAKAMREIIHCADIANQYINEQQPWKLVNTKEQHKIQLICTTGINLFKIIAIYLKPVLPKLTQQIEQLLNIDPLAWHDHKKLLLNHTINDFKKLTSRIELNTLKPEVNVKAVEDISSTQITVDDLAKVELKVAKILNAELVPEAQKLLRLKLDLGNNDIRQVFAGIKQHYAADSIIGRLTVVVANLTPRKMRFGLSEGMVLMASDGNKVLMLSPDSGAEPGMIIK